MLPREYSVVLDLSDRNLREAAHGLFQGAMSSLSGDSFMSGFASGALGSWASSAFQATKFGQSRIGMYAFSGLSGGIGSKMVGGSFIKGMTNGFMIAGLNHLQHPGAQRLEYKEGQQWQDGMPMEYINSENETLVVSEKTEKYVNIESPELQIQYRDKVGSRYNPIDMQLSAGTTEAVSLFFDITLGPPWTILSPKPNYYQQALIRNRNMKINHYRYKGIIK